MKSILRTAASVLYGMGASSALTMVVLGLGQGLFGWTDRLYDADAFFGALMAVALVGPLIGTILLASAAGCDDE